MVRIKRPSLPRQKQPTPEDVRDAVLVVIERQFYRGQRVPFLKDRTRLLSWVVLWPATWFDERGVTVSPARYQEILIGPKGILIEALRHGATGEIGYLPGWLRQCVQSHFTTNGERLYEEAKSVRTIADHLLLQVGRTGPAAIDPVRQLAQAARLLSAPRPKPRRASSADPVQGDLFGA